MAYLYASAVVPVSPLQGTGPTALSLLADTASRHLRQRERFTLYLDWRPHWRRAWMRRRALLQARATADAVISAVRARPGTPAFHAEMSGHNRFSLVLRLVPDDEWHPRSAPAPEAKPTVVYCDASASDGSLRAGLVVDGQDVTIDLNAAGTHRSSDAEFLALCLALLTAAGQRSELTVYSDETEAVHAARLLREGQFPPWVYRHGNDLVLRLTIAAMTACRLRRVHIRHVPRDEVDAAHRAADSTVAHEHMLTPRTWAYRHGVQMSWLDGQRGLERSAPNKPEFRTRKQAEADGPLWA